MRAAILLAIVEAAGPGALRRSFAHLGPAWVLVAAAAELVTFPAYVLIYRGVARLDPPMHLDALTALWIVLAGFGPLTLSGGFGVDREALLAIEGDEEQARLRVGAVAMLELVVLSTVASAVAIILLATGSSASGSLTWPWALGVPAGLVAARCVVSSRVSTRLARIGGRPGVLIRRQLDAINSVRTMAARPRHFASAWGGTGLYWAAELCTLYAALRATGINMGIELSALAYATGYLASRRSLPLGGAGISEALMVYSLHELHQSLGRAVAAVMIYRAFNFMLVIIPSLVAHRELRPLLASGDGGRRGSRRGPGRSGRC